MTLSDFHSVGVCWSDDRLGRKVHKVNNEVTRELTKEVKDMVGEFGTDTNFFLTQSMVRCNSKTIL